MKYPMSHLYFFSGSRISHGGVSKTRGRGRGRGLFFAFFFISFSKFLFMSFFLFSFLNPNSDFSRFALVVYHFYIFAPKRNEKRTMEVQVHHRKQSTPHLHTYKHNLYFNTAFQSRQSNIKAGCTKLTL